MDIENANPLVDEKSLRVDIGTELNIKIDGVSIPLKSEFVGMEMGEYLIITFPRPFQNIKHKLFRGNLITIKYIFNGKVYAFQAKLIDTIMSPKKLLLIEYPNIIELHDLRSRKRLDCFIPTKIRQKNHEHKGAILDIDNRGCRWHTKVLMNASLLSTLVVGQEITLVCQFPGIAGELEVIGKLKNTENINQETVLGIIFHKGSQKVQKVIAQYIFSAEDFFQSRKL
jgi:hypothetical protein